MTKLQAIRWFANQALTEDKVVIARNRSAWGMGVSLGEPRLNLPYNLNENDEDDKAFRVDFIKRYSPARGFANITITILHEVGHWETRMQSDMDTYGVRRDRTKNMEEFMLLKEERLATDWAIQWLYEPDHRRIAKQFEKEYFGY